MYLFTSEAVSPGHPDKCADIIADSIVDEFLRHDKNARVASEILLAGSFVTIGGEVRSAHSLSQKDYERIAKEALISIGYDGKNAFSKSQCLHPDDVEVRVLLNKQSEDIALGVDCAADSCKELETGAGDQGIMFGFASNETSSFMPAALSYARAICEHVYSYAKAHPNTLGVDIKTQVTLDYGSKDNFEACGKAKAHTIVVSAPSQEDLDIKEVRALITKLIHESSLPEGLITDKTIIHINPTGRYVNHSSLHDCGLTGRKLIVDSFGGYAPIGGGAQSSKDYTKVDRSGLYAARYIAKNIVASGLAKKCIVQLSYAIAIARPLSVSVDCMGTGLVSDEQLSSFVEQNFPLTPNWIRDHFSLDNLYSQGLSYAKIAAQGQVGFAEYPWEKLDLVAALRAIKG